MSALALCFSVEVNTHPNRQFPAHFVVHTPLCLHVLFRVARPLHSDRGCEETVTWGILGYVPSGAREPLCTDRLLCSGGWGGGEYRHTKQASNCFSIQCAHMQFALVVFKKAVIELAED